MKNDPNLLSEAESLAITLSVSSDAGFRATHFRYFRPSPPLKTSRHRPQYVDIIALFRSDSDRSLDSTNHIPGFWPRRK